MSNYASAEEVHRLRLLRGDNYQGGYQPQWVRLTAETVRAIDVKSEEQSSVNAPVTRERSESIKSEESSTSSGANIEFKGVRLL